MKRNRFIWLLVLTLFCACKKNGSDTPDVQPAITPVGVNDGTAVSQTIGNAGGTIVSDDGEVELIIPSGALTTNTNISIQPITNNAPNGRRKAYRFLPDGQQFAKNVTIKFHYTEEDALATKPEYMMAAFQTADGKWQVAGDITNDELNKTIDIGVNHFTDFSAFDIMRIEPPRLYLRTAETGEYQVTAVSMSDLNAITYVGQVLDRPETWKVNGVTGGNSSSGTIVASADGTRGVYTAPATAPATNPAVISAEINFPFIVDGQRFNRGILTAEAYIIGGRYSVELETSNDLVIGQGDIYRVHDHLRFTVNLLSQGGMVDGVQNSFPVFTKIASSTSGCTSSIEREGTGPIDLRIFDVEGVQYVPSVTNDVYVFFGSDTQEIQPLVVVTCPPQPPQTREIFIGRYAGTVIAFKDNNQDQVINGGLTGNTYTITVKPLH